MTTPGLPNNKPKRGIAFYLKWAIALFALYLPFQVYTQVVAWRFEFLPLLGDPLIGERFYPFWSGVVWYNQYSNTYPEYFDSAMSVTVSLAVSLVVLFGAVALISPKKLKRVEDLHGSARFQKDEEVRNSGLLNNSGVYLGQWEKGKRSNYLVDNGPESVLVFQPTGSGKGVGVVLPTLLSWPGSAVVLDVKGENWALSAGWRQQYANNHVFCLDPGSATDSHAYNPMAEIRLGTDYEFSDAQNIALMICDKDGKGIESDHWRATSYSLITAAILHVAIKANLRGEVGTLPEVARFLVTFNDEDEGDTPWVEMENTIHRNGRPLPLIKEAAEEQHFREFREKSSVASSVNTYMNVFRDPIIARNMGHSDFSVADLMNNEQPVSLYLVLRSADRDRLRPIVRLVLTQIVRQLTRDMSFREGAAVKNYKHRLLLMLDEFPTLGKLPIVSEALSYVRSYGIKPCVIVQDREQIISEYGREEAITSACRVQAATAPNKLETAEYVSKLAGDTTVVKESPSVSRRKWGLADSNVTRSIQEVRRPLLTPDEASRLPGLKKDEHDSSKVVGPGNILIFPRGQYPIYAKQILYFQDPVFSDRAKVEAPGIDECLPIVHEAPIRHKVNL